MNTEKLLDFYCNNKPYRYEIKSWLFWRFAKIFYEDTLLFVFRTDISFHKTIIGALNGAYFEGYKRRTDEEQYEKKEKK